MALKSIAPSKTEWTVLHQHCTMEHWRRMRCRNGKLPRPPEDHSVLALSSSLRHSAVVGADAVCSQTNQLTLQMEIISRRTDPATCALTIRYHEDSLDLDMTGQEKGPCLDAAAVFGFDLRRHSFKYRQSHWWEWRRQSSSTIKIGKKPSRAGGGWKPGPGMTDKGKIFVVGSGLGI